MLALVCSLSAQAQQYRWIDEKGRVQYTDTPPPPSAKSVQKKNLSGAKPDATGNEPYALQLARKANPVRLYSSPECGEGCSEARMLLNRRGVPFVEISVVGPAGLEDLKKVSGGNAVPVLMVGTRVQKGFEESAFHRALDAGGYPASGVLPPRKQAAPSPMPPQPEAPKPEAPTEPVQTNTPQ